MEPGALQTLICPLCGGSLAYNGPKAEKCIVKGDFQCKKCSRIFTVENGILEFISKEEITGNNKITEKFYNLFSPFYDLFNQVILLFIGGHKKVQMEYLGRLKINGGSVLEISVGTGANIPFLSEHADEIFGIDLSAGQLKKCTKNLGKWKLDANLFLANAEQLPFKDESFDSVFHVGGINFFSNKKKAIGEMIRVARPGAKMLIADESEKGRKFYENIGFKLWEDQKTHVSPPIEFIPNNMLNIKVDPIWKGYGYCIEFTKPQ